MGSLALSSGSPLSAATSPVLLRERQVRSERLYLSALGNDVALELCDLKPFDFVGEARLGSVADTFGKT